MRGGMVGELAFLSNTPGSASVVAVRDSILARMVRKPFERFLTSWPQVAPSVMRTVVTRFRRAERARQPMKWPITICRLPITGEVADLATRFAAARAELAGPVAILTHATAPHASDEAGTGAIKR